MPKYSYNVVNRENKALSGTISAPDEKSARLELNQLGFSVVGINKIVETQENEKEIGENIIFEFAAIDKNQKRIIGSIQAEDRFSGYKRLIQEYAFEVEYLVDQSLTEIQKNAEKIKGVFELQNRMDEEALETQKKTSGESEDLKEFELKQQVLKSQVEFVLKKVKEMLDLYETEMKLEIKEQIKKFVDKILRIKSSTNLDYVRKTCEELLTYLQKEEIFLHEEARMRERTQMVLEAKTMMMQLHSTKSKKSLSYQETLSRWREEHILNNEHPGTGEKIVNIIIGFLIGFTPENEEIKEIQNKIAIISQQIKQYWLLSLQAATAEYKMETRTSLKKLRQEKRRLVKQLNEAKNRLRQEYKKRPELSGFELFTQEIGNFTGWLLAFYILYYFATIYLNTKQIDTSTFPKPLTIYDSNFLKYFFTTLFLFHCSLSIKVNFFRRNDVATLVITPVFLLSSLLIILNF